MVSTAALNRRNKVIDTHSFARPSEAKTVHLDLDLDVDFDTHIIQGTARHTIENNGSERFIVDTRDLNIVKVTVDDSDLAVTHQLTEQEGVKGRALVVPITKGTRTVTIYYFTDPGAAALGWLDPEQTADKTMPFLYTQGTGDPDQVVDPATGQPWDQIYIRCAHQCSSRDDGRDEREQSTGKVR